MYNFNWQRVKTLRVSNVKLERVRKGEIKIQFDRSPPSSSFFSVSLSKGIISSLTHTFHCIFPFYVLSQQVFRYTLIFNFQFFFINNFNNYRHNRSSYKHFKTGLTYVHKLFYSLFP